jgi:hypothetical protein
MIESTQYLFKMAFSAQDLLTAEAGTIYKIKKGPFEERPPLDDLIHPVVAKRQ